MTSASLNKNKEVVVKNSGVEPAMFSNLTQALLLNLHISTKLFKISLDFSLGCSQTGKDF